MRTILATLALVALAASAFARDVNSDVQKLESDIDARVAAIASAASKESKNLSKARTKLSTYNGGSTVADFKILAGAGKFLAASRTADPAIVDDATAMVQALVDCATLRHDLAAAAIDQLLDPGHVAIVKDLFQKADVALKGATASVSKNPVKAAALAVQAYDTFGFALGTADGFLQKEDGSPLPPGLSVSTPPNQFQLVNAGPSSYDVSKIRVFADVTSSGNSIKTYVGRDATSIVKGLFPNAAAKHVGAGTTFDLTTIIAQFIPAGTVGGRVAGQLWITLKGQKFFVVEFDYTAP